MAAKKVLNHIHKLKKHTHSNKESIFFCTLGECEYKINVSIALGKPNECWRCGRTFNLNEYALRLAKPHCSNCKKTKDGKIQKEMLDIELPDYPARPATSNDGPGDNLDLLSRIRKTISHGGNLLIDPNKSEDDLL